MAPPPWFFRAMATIPKATGLLSLVGSTLVLQDVLRSAERRHRVYSRIMVGMSAMDGIWAVICFLSTWPLPPEYLPPLHGAAGTIKSCVAVGFFGIASSLSSILYSGGLTLFFLLVIRNGWREERIAKRLERWIHAVPLVVGWGVGLACVVLELISPTTWMCWIQHFPYNCVESYTVRDGEGQEGNCVRGDNAGIYRWAFMFGWVWFVWAFNGIAMALIYHKILRNEDASSKHSFRLSSNRRESGQSSAASKHKEDRRSSGTSTGTGRQTTSTGKSWISTSINQSILRIRSHIGRSSATDEGVSRKHSSKFASQALCYSFFFFLTWIIPTVQASIQSFSRRYFWQMMICTVVLMPLQGFFNSLVYFRPRVLHRLRERRRSRSQQGGASSNSAGIWRWRWKFRRDSNKEEEESGSEMHSAPPAKSVTINTLPHVQQQISQVSQVDESATDGDDGDAFRSESYLE